MKVTIKTNVDEVKRKFSGLSDKRLYAWVSYTFREQAEEYTEYVRNAWLHGRAMDWRTGDTARSVQPWTRKRDRHILIRPGVNVPGVKNYLYRYIGTKHEFMRPAWKQFAVGNRVEDAVRQNLDKMLDQAMKKD